MNIKKRAKISLAMGCIMAVTSASAVFAEYDPNKEIDPNQVSTKSVAISGVLVDGDFIEGAKTYISQEKRMLPLRAICEKAGFSVNWDEETEIITLSKGPVYITMNAYDDAYTFSKTAPMTLGKAPELVEYRTYVPSEFFTELLNYQVNVYGDVVNVLTHSDKREVTVVSVSENEITVNDQVFGEVVLIVADETKVTDQDGKDIKITEIKEGASLFVHFGDAMTMSLPPQNVPVSIALLK